MTDMNDVPVTTPVTTGAVSPPMALGTVVGRVGWLCARCARSYSPDVRECVACVPPGLVQTTYWLYPSSYYTYPRTYTSDTGGYAP
jgi:hypothetical protein